MNQMLGLSGKYFKAINIKILQKPLWNSSERNEKKKKTQNILTINKDAIKKNQMKILEL